MAKRAVSNPLALAVLACLAERPMHPYEISSTLKERGKEHSIKLNYGSLYSVVDALQRHGLIEAGETRQQGNRPARTTYEITEAGTAELHDWMRELLSTPVKEYPQLEAALSLLPALPPDEVVSLLEERTSRLTARLAELDEADREAIHAGLPRLFMVEFDYHVAMLRAELHFVRDLARRIRDGTLEGVAVWRRLQQLRCDGHSFAEITANPAKYFGEEVARWFGSLREPPSQH